TGETVGYLPKRDTPTDTRHGSIRLPHHRMQKTGVEPERFTQCRALGAKLAEIRRMVGVPDNHCGPPPIGFGQYAAAYAAIGTGGAHCRRMVRGCVHQYT